MFWLVNRGHGCLPFPPALAIIFVPHRVQHSHCFVGVFYSCVFFVDFFQLTLSRFPLLLLSIAVVKFYPGKNPYDTSTNMRSGRLEHAWLDNEYRGETRYSYLIPTLVYLTVRGCKVFPIVCSFSFSLIMEGLEVIEVARCYDVERVSSFIWQRGGRRSKEIIMCFIMLKGAFGSIKRRKRQEERIQRVWRGGTTHSVLLATHTYNNTTRLSTSRTLIFQTFFVLRCRKLSSPTHDVLCIPEKAILPDVLPYVIDCAAYSRRSPHISPRIFLFVRRPHFWWPLLLSTTDDLYEWVQQL